MAEKKRIVCPDCDGTNELDRRDFLRVGALATAAAAAGAPLFAVPRAAAAPSSSSAAETAVKALYATLTDKQRQEICFDWDYKHPQLGLLRTRVANNWHITKPVINSDFFTKDQKALIRDVYKGIFNPEWIAKIDKQLKDDTEGHPWGTDQNIAIFGKPGDGNFEFVMTGRHLTARADGNSASHVALGGPIFHGHAASGFNEKPDHPGNIFWHQALTANKLYTMLDGKQQKTALVEKLPREQDAKFRGPKGGYPGLAVAEMSNDQKEHLHKVLLALIEPYRKEDQDEVQACLQAQGGLEKCSLAFYKDQDIGNDGVWDNWRVEGPSFVWYFRGAPHVHIWINVADDPSVQLNA